LITGEQDPAMRQPGLADSRQTQHLRRAPDP
jgi:hypothetical protein